MKNIFLYILSAIILMSCKRHEKDKVSANFRYSEKKASDSLISQNSSVKKPVIVYNNQQKSLLKDWDGKYSLILNEDSEDWRNIHEIKIMIAKDSVTYSAEGFQLYEYYVLTSKENQNSINLNFLKALDNTANEYHLQKTKDFGTISFDGKDYILQSPYIDLNFNDGKKQKYKLKKSK